MLAQAIAAATAATTLLIAPWTGHDYPSASQAYGKYRLTVRHAAGTPVRLHAQGVARGWIAAFCTRALCSPMQITLDFSTVREIVLQFELIKTDAHASSSTRATIFSDDGASRALMR